VNDLAIAMVNPEEFVNVLQSKHKFHMKGTGPLEFHHGADFYYDSDGILCMAPSKYIEWLVASYERMFGEKLKINVYSPLEKGDHLELDVSELLDSTSIAQYQSLIGSL